MSWSRGPLKSSILTFAIMYGILFAITGTRPDWFMTSLCVVASLLPVPVRENSNERN